MNVPIHDHSQHGGAKPPKRGKAKPDEKAMKTGAPQAGGPHQGMQMDKAMPGPASGANAGMDHGGTGMALPPAMRATTTQKIAWAILSVLILVAGVLIP